MVRFKSGKQRGPLSFRAVIFLSLAIFLAISLQTFIYIEKRLEPALMEIAIMETKLLAEDAVNDAISKKIAQSVDFRQLVEISKDKDGKIRGVHFNYNAHTRITGEAISRISEAMKDIQSNELYIPLGQALQSNILATIGPDIPITIVPYGAPLVTLSSTMKEAGINMVMATIYIDIQVEVKVVIPFTTESTWVRTQVPLSQMLIVGDVPYFYWDGQGNPVGNQGGSGAYPILPPIQFVPKQTE